MDTTSAYQVVEALLTAETDSGREVIDRRTLRDARQALQVELDRGLGWEIQQMGYTPTVSGEPPRNILSESQRATVRAQAEERCRERISDALGEAREVASEYGVDL